MLARAAGWCYRNRGQTLALWVVGFVLMVVLGGAAGGSWSTDFEVPGTGSAAAQDLLAPRFPARAGDTIQLVLRTGSIDDPAVRARFESILGRLLSYPHVVDAASPYNQDGAQNTSLDRSTAFAVLQLDVPAQDIPAAEGRKLIAETRAANAEGVRFALSGQAVQNAEFVLGGREEGIGLFAAGLILLLSFGSVIGLGLPILASVAGIGIGLAVVQLLANVVPAPNFTPIVASTIGLGVGIDYALFIVARYRQGLHSGLDPETAAIVSVSTAGRAVLFAGTTVVVSVLGMLLVNLRFLRGVALGAAAAVLVTMLASVSLLPALLGFAGRNIDRLRAPFVKAQKGDPRRGFWFRWSRLVQRRPGTAFILGLVALGALATPLFSLHLGFPGQESQPRSRMSRQAYDMLVAGFGPGYSAPLILAVDLPGGQGRDVLAKLERDLRTVLGVAAVAPAQLNPAADVAVITVFPTTRATDKATENLVHRLRDHVVPAIVADSPARVHVGGSNAGLIDSSETIRTRLPVFIGVVVALSLLLLMAEFRSVTVALKAAVMNMLSIGAAYGVLVAACQWGWLSDVTGITPTPSIASFVPMMMFAILFGLSMDYEVFLLSRVREEYLCTGDNALAVADGLASTARVITAAAASMVAACLAFVLGPEPVVKQIGLGLAAAIFIDATLVRMVLVPSTMELLGKATWWIPRWLDRILPRVGFESFRSART